VNKQPAVVYSYLSRSGPGTNSLNWTVGPVVGPARHPVDLIVKRPEILRVHLLGQRSHRRKERRQNEGWIYEVSGTFSHPVGNHPY